MVKVKEYLRKLRTIYVITYFICAYQKLVFN